MALSLAVAWRSMSSCVCVSAYYYTCRIHRNTGIYLYELSMYATHEYSGWSKWQWPRPVAFFYHKYTIHSVLCSIHFFFMHFFILFFFCLMFFFLNYKSPWYQRRIWRKKMLNTFTYLVHCKISHMQYTLYTM
jgi:hypothetical protein